MQHLAGASDLEATTFQDGPYFPGAMRTTRNFTTIHEFSGKLPTAQDAAAVPRQVITSLLSIPAGQH